MSGLKIKLKNTTIKLYWSGIEFGEWYYFYWWNKLRKGHRYLGPMSTWYDGPHLGFGFWFFNWTWSTPWNATTKHMKDPWEPWIDEYERSKN